MNHIPDAMDTKPWEKYQRLTVAMTALSANCSRSDDRRVR
jgi:hypothetical protein